jgi:DNA-binding LacI/PurR family transcriptional regulator
MSSPPRKRRVSAKEVAAAAGVSVMSVSNAFNRPEKLSAERRLEILQIAQRLGYSGPDPAGRSLRLGRVGAIGVVLTASLAYAIDDPAAVMLLRGIAEVGELSDVALTLVPTSSVGTSRVQNVVVDGLILYTLPDGDKSAAAAVARRLPIVVVDGPALPGHPIITSDDAGGARQAAQHLVDLGHRRFAILVDRLAPDGHAGVATPARARAAEYGWARERVVAYLNVLAAAGIPASDVAIEEAGGYSAGESRKAVASLLDRNGVTGILASTDVLALAAIDEVRARGMRVGGDISIVGFDDIPAAAAADLTTISHPLVERGRLAAQMLLAAMRGEHPEDRRLETSLVVRASTGPARKRIA